MSTKSVVVDSSALFALFFPEEYSEWVEEKVREYVELHTLELAFLETSNAAWKRIALFGQPQSRVLENLNMLHRFMEDVCIIHRDLDHLHRALELSIELRITVYDALFLALAEKQKTKLLTIDRKLVETLKHVGEQHRVISPWTT